ncbi:Peptidase A2A, retrovirus RVP subgroup [Candidatus Magnetomorum sp. HK-1]|nr:Peptidase A2A, retrovirus RVP subgroup [Candidatus Magnetomorum sp. HK-1]
MKLLIRYNLPFIKITVGYRNLSIDIPNILLDTGSATTILNADIISSIGIKPEANDTTAQIVGIGGEESVYHKNQRSRHENLCLCNLLNTLNKSTAIPSQVKLCILKTSILSM